MKELRFFARATVAAILGMSANLILPAHVIAATTLMPGFAPDPQVVTGRSGGSRVTTDCGSVKSTHAPDYVLTLSQPFEFLRASVQAEGDVTLMVEGPTGRICSDDVNGLMPEISGAAPVGTYSFWIGDYRENSERGYRYRLVFSEE